MHEPVADVVPDALRAQLHGVAVAALAPVLERVLPVVPPAPDAAANQTRPQGGGLRGFLAARTVARRHGVGARRVPAHGARVVFPVAHARGVERVRAHRGHHAARLVVQSVQAHRATRELDERVPVVARGRAVGDALCFCLPGGHLHAPHEQHAALLFAERVELAVVVVTRERVRALLVREAQDHAVRRSRFRETPRGRGDSFRRRRVVRLRRSFVRVLPARRDHAHLHHRGRERGDEAAEVADAERRRHGQDAHRGMPTPRERVRVIPDVTGRPGGRRGGGEGVAKQVKLAVDDLRARVARGKRQRAPRRILHGVPRLASRSVGSRERAPFALRVFTGRPARPTARGLAPALGQVNPQREQRRHPRRRRGAAKLWPRRGPRADGKKEMPLVACWTSFARVSAIFSVC